MKRAASTAFYPTPAEAVDFLRKEVAQQRAAIQRETDKANEFARQVSAIADKYKV
jgi:hypothetical protein